MTSVTTHEPVVVAKTTGMPRQEWLALRRHGIGGSDVAALIGESQYSTELSLFWDKRGELPDDDNTSDAARAGNYLEPAVAHWFEDETGLDTREVGVMFAHPDRPWMLADVDRYVYDSAASTEPLGLLEIKTTDLSKAGEWDEHDVPIRHLFQIQHYLAVTGLERAWLAVLIGGNRFRHYEVDRDEDLIAAVMAIEERFWQRVQDGDMPDVDDSEATSAAIAARFRDTVDTIQSLDPSVLDLVDQRQAAKDAVAHADTWLTGIENQLKVLLGEHTVGELDGQPTVTWKPQSRRGLEEKALNQTAPPMPVCLLGLWGDLSPLAGFRTTSTFRVLRFPKRKAPR